MQYGLTATALLGATLAACASGQNGGNVGGGGGSADFSVTDGATATGDLASAGGDAAMPPTDTLDANRDRLLATYLTYLQAHPGAQSNGLDGATLAGVCDLWTRLDPSSQAVFLTLTARMQGSHLGAGGSAMLAHVTRAYRVVGGQGAAAGNPGSCGGGEYNRMIVSVDGALHDALVAANTHQGAAGAGGLFDLADVQPGSNRFWRDSHDAAGPHTPFDLSDETESGAPRGQVQYFRDPTSAAATAPLGRMDLSSLVDPSALEIDQDYDCVHNSNPSCSYVTYGALCAPMASKLGVDLYESNYGPVEVSWRPNGC
ncbi:MAG: Peptidyl-prolyl cis-trans isomerase [bacterium]|nr:Peptidyl-prolyl cis-trans isomerase [bacterium]